MYSHLVPKQTYRNLNKHTGITQLYNLRCSKSALCRLEIYITQTSYCFLSVKKLVIRWQVKSGSFLQSLGSWGVAACGAVLCWLPCLLIHCMQGFLGTSTILEWLWTVCESETLSWNGVSFFVMKMQRNNKPPKAACQVQSSIFEEKSHLL